MSRSRKRKLDWLPGTNTKTVPRQWWCPHCRSTLLTVRVDKVARTGKHRLRCVVECPSCKADDRIALGSGS